MPIVDSIYTKLKRALVGVGVVVRTSAASVLADDPTISSGSGAPSGSEPNGSVYLRTNGATYTRVGGAWVLDPATATTVQQSSLFLSTEQTGTGSAQNVAHGLGSVPTVAVVTLSELGAGLAGGADVAYGTHTSTNVVVTVTSGLKFYVLAIK